MSHATLTSAAGWRWRRLGHIERMGTGTRDMITRCQEAGLEEPRFKQADGFVVTLARQPARTGRTIPKGVTGTKSGPSRDQVGTKSGLSRDQVEILRKCLKERSIRELMAAAARSNRTKFRDQVLRPLLDRQWVEPTIPDKPTSSKQRYRLTALGHRTLALIDEEGSS